MSRYATIAACAALLVGCGGSRPPIGAPGAMAQTFTNAAHADRATSWMLPETKADTLLYVSLAVGYVYVYSYPSRKLVGQLSGFDDVGGLCSDRAGHVFVTDAFRQAVYEYAHGGTQPIATFTDESVNGAFGPVSCSVDFGSNNLAVEAGDVHYVFIFKDESQTATVYENPFALGDFCTYDGNGNFFARGTRNHIAELARGSSTFKNIPLSRPIDENIGGFAWDGRYLSIATDDSTSTVFDDRIRVRGSKAIVVSSRKITAPKQLWQFTIYDNQFVSPVWDRPRHTAQVTFWKYPGFGKSVGAIGGLTEPVGTAVSVSR